MVGDLYLIYLITANLNCLFGWMVLLTEMISRLLEGEHHFLFLLQL